MQKLKLLDLKKSSGLAHQLRQLVDIGRNPSRFIAGERLGCRFELRPRLAALKPFQSAFEFFGASSRHGKITSASIQTCGAAALWTVPIVAVRLSKFYPGPLRFWLQRAALVIMTLVVIALAAEYVW